MKAESIISKSYWSGSTVVITGASGFLGRSIVDKLLAVDARVVCISRRRTHQIDPKALEFLGDLTSPKTLPQILGSVNGTIDCIIHCAALDGNASFKRNNPSLIFDTNLRMASNVLRASRDFSINNVSLISSTEIYSKQIKTLAKEEDDFKVHPCDLRDGYATSKVSIEILAGHFQQECGFSLFLPRPTNMYGPGDTIAEERRRVIPSMFHSVLNNIPIPIWGGGRQTRHFIHIDDAANGILLMIEHGIFGPLNIASPERISIRRLAETVFQLADMPENFEFHTSKTPITSREVDASRLLGLLSPRSLNEGLSQTFQWFQATFNTIDITDRNAIRSQQINEVVFNPT